MAAPYDDIRGRNREWFEVPLPLVGFVGCEDTHADLIKKLPNKSPISISTLTAQPSFPRRKVKRATYEGYEPVGLMKTNWVAKRRRKVPAAFVIFVDVSDWSKLETIMTTSLASLRDAPNFPRDSRVLLALPRGDNFQDDPALPKRLDQWAKRNGVDNKMVFVLNPSVASSLAHLEQIAHEQACEAYRAVAKRIKQLKHKVQRSTQQPLYVRHHFKIAYYASMLGDSTQSLKYYVSSYNFLRQLVYSPSGTYCMELKSVAEVLNYKIMALLVGLDRVPEALAQFQTHIQNWKNAVGPQALEFHHWMWLAQQYYELAELLVKIDSTKLANKWEFNSGHCYQTSAMYAKRRKEHAVVRLAEEKSALPPRSAYSSSVFLGQPLCKIGDTADTKPSEAAILTSALIQESFVGHSQQVIALLTKAYDHFEKLKVDRIVLHIVTQMGMECFDAKNYQMAKKLMGRILRAYRKDSWNSILTCMVNKSLHCARELNLDREIVLHSLELMSSHSLTSKQERMELYQKLGELLDSASLKHIELQSKGEPAEPKQADADDMSLFSAPIDIDKRMDVLECRAHFMAPAEGVVRVKETVELVLRVTSNFPTDVRFAKLQISFSPKSAANEPCTNEVYNFEIVPDDSPGYDREHVLTLPSKAADQTREQLRAPTDYAPGSSRTYCVRFQADYATLPDSPLLPRHVAFALVSIKDVGGPGGPPLLCVRCPVSPLEEEHEVVSVPLQIQSKMRSLVIMRGAGTHREYQDHHGVGLPTKQEKKDQEAAVAAARGAEPEQQQAKTQDSRDKSLGVRSTSLRVTPAKPRAYVVVEVSGPVLVQEFHRVMLTVHADQDYMRNTKLQMTYVIRDGDGPHVADLDTAIDTNTVAVAVADGGAAGGVAGAGATSDLAASNGDGVMFFEYDESLEDAHVVDDDSRMKPITEAIRVPDMNPGAREQICVYMRSTRTHDHTIGANINVVYDNENAVNLTYVSKFKVDVKVPFRARFSLLGPYPTQNIVSLANDNLVTAGSQHGPFVLPNEPCVLSVNIENIGPHQLRLKKLTATIPCCNQDTLSKSIDCSIGANERYSTCLTFMPSKLGQVKLPNAFRVLWTRDFGESPGVVRTFQRSRALTQFRHRTGYVEENSSLLELDALEREIKERAENREIREERFTVDYGSKPLEDGGKGKRRKKDKKGGKKDKRNSLQVERFSGSVASSMDTNTMDVANPMNRNSLPRQSLWANTSLRSSTSSFSGAQPFREVPSVIYSCDIPPFEVKLAPLVVDVRYPPTSEQGVEFLMTASIRNQTLLPQSLNLVLEEAPAASKSKALCVCGHLNTSFTVLPKEEHVVVFKLVPLQCGQLSLPTLRISVLPSNALVLNKDDVGGIFVHPIKKASVRKVKI